MAEPPVEEVVPLQIAVRSRTRNRLKHAAIDAKLSMSVLGDALLDYALALVLESAKVPPAFAALLEKAKKAAADKAKKDKEDEDA